MSANTLITLEQGLEGALDAMSVSRLCPLLDQLVEEHQEDVCLKMHRIEFIDSSGVGALVFLFKRLRENGRDLTLSGVHGQPLELIRFLRIDQIIRLQS
ncbi:STAS domain-containing protein [Bowmanella sp. JS7-9]|uniref:STAS domain-containing protein n=1 Tax=Pseudobowmanella zhangzhouensis TaxID=1537679 RepID=A0ABW1XID4_9ALTE|nr:STAS domain-containing protein [Bowmanella sp. JS7-9]TBX24682.1 hypothetical protein TK45_04460 [Bowmanella sp. JS7-9]